jgi:hypothetical protein
VRSECIPRTRETTQRRSLSRRIADSLGVSHILVKPCEPEAIIHMVAEALGSGNTPPPPIVGAEFDREQLRVMNGKMFQQLQELLQSVGRSKSALHA